MQDLMLKASESIALLWLSQLETISASTGVEMSVLCGCLNLHVPEKVDKKKRAPAKKKESLVVVATNVVDVPEHVLEKKKRAPAKKKESLVVVATNVVDVPEQVLEKKKRAPAKKKESVVAVVSSVVNDVPEQVLEKKKRAPAKKEEVVVVVDVREEVPAKKEEVEPNVEVELETVVVVKSKKVSEKKALKTKPSKTDNDALKNEKKAQKKADKKADKKIATTIANDDDNDADSVSCSGDTVIMPPSPPPSPRQSPRQSPEESCKPRIDVEEVIIGATSFLVSDNNVAYLKSSRLPVGKYDPIQKSILHCGSYADEDDVLDDDVDECPVLSDMSDDE
jgi:hypothetical protein